MSKRIGKEKRISDSFHNLKVSDCADERDFRKQRKNLKRRMSKIQRQEGKKIKDKWL